MKETMRRLAAILMAALMMTASIAAADGTWTDGSYTGTSAGFGGDVTVELEIAKGKLANVSITGDQETESIGQAAFDKLAAGLLAAQHAEIEAVAGATVTSEAVKNAAAAALGQAAAEEMETVQAEVKDGVYHAVGHGYHGEIPVTVTIENGQMTEIEVGENQETAGVADIIIIRQPELILENQSWNVDSISGATYTANAIKQAVRAALKEAGAAEGMFDTKPEIAQYDQAYETDVVVVGGGIAGMTAAIEAAEAGSKVILVEKLGRLGGSTVLSGGNFYATGSPINAEYDNDPEDMKEYFMMRSEGLADEELITFYAENSGANVAWLIEHLGAQYAPTTGAVSYSPAKRQHYGANRGASITVPAYEKMKELGVEILMETRANQLLTDENGTVSGITAQDAHGTVSIHSKAVVLASGGYDQNRELMEKYSPIGAHSIPISGNGNTGDGLLMALELGADTVFRNVAGGIQVVNPLLYPEDGVNLLVWVQTLFVTGEGERFINESEWYTTVYDRMAQIDSPKYYWIFDAVTSTELCEEAVAQGYGFKAETVEELADLAGMDPKTLRAAVDQYNEAAISGSDELFGRTGFAPLADAGVYYAIDVKMATCDSIGGLKTSVKTEVLRDGMPIPGLYAAGEIANGQFFGNTYSSDGAMVGISVTFGRQAGIHAAEYANK